MFTLNRAGGTQRFLISTSLEDHRTAILKKRRDDGWASVSELTLCACLLVPDQGQGRPFLEANRGTGNGTGSAWSPALRLHLGTA